MKPGEIDRWTLAQVQDAIKEAADFGLMETMRGLAMDGPLGSASIVILEHIIPGAHATVRFEIVLPDSDAPTAQPSRGES